MSPIWLSTLGQDGDEHRAEHDAPQRAHAAQHRDQQKADRLVDREALHAGERDVVREQAAGDAAEQRAQHEHAGAQPLQVDAEAGGGFAGIPHAAQHQAGAAVHQIADQQHGQERHAPGEIVEAPGRIELEAEEIELRDAADAEFAAGQPVPFVEDRAGDDAQRQRRQRQEIAGQAQHRPADDERDRHRDRGADHEAGDVRVAELDRQIGAGIGADAVERRLSEVDDAALAEQQADADARDRVDRGEHQKIGEMARQQVRQRRPKHQAKQGEEQAAPHQPPPRPPRPRMPCGMKIMIAIRIENVSTSL